MNKNNKNNHKDKDSPVKNQTPRNSFARLLQLQRGVIMPAAAVSLLALFAMAGFAIDTGLAFKDRRDSQIAADAAALAGAHELYRGNSSAEAQAAALRSAAENGFKNGEDNISITFNHPPKAGYYIGNMRSAEVLIERPTRASFLPVIDIWKIDVGTRAVANGDQAQSFNCVYVLDRNQEGSFEVTSDSVLEADCGIRVNSSNSRGSTVESGACVKAGFVGITGGYTTGQVCDSGGGSAYQCTQSDTCPSTGVPPIPDPLASYDPPPVNYDHCDHGSRGGDRKEVKGGTIYPGTYCGGIKAEGNVKMAPGTYIMRGGGFYSNSATITQTIPGAAGGVTIYNTCARACNGNEDDEKDFSPIEFVSGSDVTLSAPDSGPMKDMLLFQDPDGPTSPDPGNYPSNRIDSSTTAVLDGMMYFPTQHFKYHSSTEGTTPTEAIIVALFFEVSSNSRLDIANEAGSRSFPMHRVTLVE
ncbi:MAG: pilus assembly protein TadG-related protein [Gammaproteobacteria bacterium]